MNKNTFQQPDMSFSGASLETADSVARAAHVWIRSICLNEMQMEEERLALAGGLIAGLCERLALNPRVRELVATSADTLGGLDVLVCNAGVWKEAPVASMSEAEWDETIDINLKGMYLATHCSLPYLRNSDAAAIINIASTAGQRGEARYAHYAASKGGMIAWTKSLAPELAAHGIRVNCVAPGWINTEMAAEALAKAGDTITSIIPLGRAGEPEEIASVACFLASDLASFTTGHRLMVTGGRLPLV